MSPLDDIENAESKYAVGFRLIHSEWSTFGGLVRTAINNSANCISTLLDGMPGNIKWHYSIGMYSYCDTIYGSRLPPGPRMGVKEIYLWMRIPVAIKNTLSCRLSNHIRLLF